jgi:hypothetical protein
MATFTVYGNWGTLTVDADTGFVLDYDTADSDWEKPGDGYEDIVRFDVPTLKASLGDEPVENAIVDIIRIGFWTTGGKYEEPVPFQED